MTWKKFGKALLFPHIAVMILLTPIAAFLLVWSMVAIGTETAVAYGSYVLAAYTLTVWCFRIPRAIRFFKRFKEENKYARIWREDTRLRVSVSLYGSLAWNALYGIFQLWLGVYHRTFWFCSLGAYYICLGAMRFFLLLHTRRYAPGEKMKSELIKYVACGWVFLLMNLALTLIIFFMVYWNRTFSHHMITAITMAAYTFSAVAASIIGVVKFRKYNSPVFSAAKAISLASALVSMLTLESTMLTTFNDGTVTAVQRKWMLGATGGIISALIVLEAVYMIVSGVKQLKKIKNGGSYGKR
ncbi:MAG: hypothetical protein IKM00_06110 [Clostridia bacterium]|nr:hypothetical protein [Clostridia bacterium]